MSHSPAPTKRLAQVLADLPVHRYAVTLETLTGEVVSYLESHSETPGVLVMEDEELVGMVIREQLLEQLSRPFGQELFLRRPVENLLKSVDSSMLCLAETSTIAGWLFSSMWERFICNRTFSVLGGPSSVLALGSQRYA